MKRLLTGALALSLLTGTAAMAQPYNHDDHGRYDQSRHNDRDDNRGYGHDKRGYGHDNRGYGHGHRWARQRCRRGDLRPGQRPAAPRDG